MTDHSDINSLFKNKYQKLYNSAPSELSAIYEYVDSHIGEEILPNISTDLLDEAIKLLKQDKSDGDKGLWSTLVIETPDSWRKLLASLIECMIVHGHYASELLLSTIVSMPKDIQKGSVCDSDNYRGIALMSPINKVVDLIFLLKYPNCFKTSPLQFAFKKGHSTSMCTYALKEVVSYHRNRKGQVYCAMLDASKAFDGVIYEKLFELLINRGLPVPMLRLLSSSKSF